MMESERQNLIGMTRVEMQSFFASLGVREFHARQVLQWIYQRGINDFSRMTDLSKLGFIEEMRRAHPDRETDAADQDEAEVA